MRFERMTDDELKRFLLLGTECLDWAAGTVEAARRWLAYEQQDVDDESLGSYQRGYDLGYEEGKLDAKAEA